MRSELRASHPSRRDARRPPGARWKRDVLAGLRDVEGTELALVVLAPAARSRRRSLASLLLRLYSAVDRRIFALEPDPLEVVDVAGLIEGVVTVERRGGGTAGAADVEVDVAIMLGAEADVLLDDAPLGVWTYRHGLGRERADDVPVPARRQGEAAREPRRARAPVRPGRARALDDQDRSRLDAAGPQRGAAALPPSRGPAPARPPDGAEPRRAGGGARDRAAARELGVVEVLRASAASPRACSLRRLFNTLWHEQWLLVVRRSRRRAADRASSAPASTSPRAAATGPTRSRSGSTAGPGCSSRRSRGAAPRAHHRRGARRGGRAARPAGRARDAAPPLLPLRLRARRRHYLLPESRASSATTLYRARDFPDDWEPRVRARRCGALRPDAPPSRRDWWLFGTIADWASPRTTSCTCSTPTRSRVRGTRIRATRSSPTCAGRARRGRSSATARACCGPRRTAPGATGARWSSRRCSSSAGRPTARSRWRGSSPTGSSTTWPRTTMRPASGGRRPTPCCRRRRW